MLGCWHDPVMHEEDPPWAVAVLVLIVCLLLAGLAWVVWAVHWLVMKVWR